MLLFVFIRFPPQVSIRFPPQVFFLRLFAQLHFWLLTYFDSLLCRLKPFSLFPAVFSFCKATKFFLWESLNMFLQCFDTVGWVIWSVKTCPRYDLECVQWDVKPYSITIICENPCKILSVVCKCTSLYFFTVISVSVDFYIRLLFTSLLYSCIFYCST